MPGSSLVYAISDPIPPYNFTNIPPSNFDAASDTINLGIAHNFVNGDCIWGNASGYSLVIAGITRWQKYFVIVVDSTRIKLATSLTNAQIGTPLDISVPSQSMAFTKLNGSSFGSGDFQPVIVDQSPAYAESSILFNSSIPVEINFTVPAYTPPAQIAFSWPIQVVLRQPQTNKYWGAITRIQNIFMFYAGTIDSLGLPTAVSYTSSGAFTALTLGYNQKYVISPSRTIECWIGIVGSALSLYYTTPALSANTPLVLAFGSSFSFCKIENCTIKYL